MLCIDRSRFTSQVTVIHMHEMNVFSSGNNGEITYLLPNFDDLLVSRQSIPGQHNRLSPTWTTLFNF